MVCRWNHFCKPWVSSRTPANVVTLVYGCIGPPCGGTISGRPQRSRGTSTISHYLVHVMPHRLVMGFSHAEFVDDPVPGPAAGDGLLDADLAAFADFTPHPDHPGTDAF